MENHPVRFIIVYDQDAASGLLSRGHDGQGGRRLFEKTGGTLEGTAASRLTGDADVAAHLFGELF